MSVAMRRVLIWGVLGAALAAAIAYALRPQPVLVDLATARTGLLRVTVDDEGEARVRDVYTLHAPVGGYLQRIDAEAGDPVEANRTVLARIEPAPPAFLDVRSQAEQRAAIEAARAGRDLAAADLERAEADLAFATAELERAQRLIKEDNISQRSLDDAQRAQRVAHANLATARATLEMREHELARARSRLLSREELAARIAKRDDDCDCVTVTAPVGGVVLHVVRESAGVIEAGTALVEIGDPGNLEVVVDLLSEDAVGIEPGQKAIIAGWGGPDLDATVRRVEPFGRTEVSALGIEEQRVDVVLDFTATREAWRRLGHGYRVDVRVILFEGDVLQVPLGALFRDGEQWAVFVAGDGRARLRHVEVGARNGLSAEIRDGLAAGDRVVLYPSERIADGTAVSQR